MNLVFDENSPEVLENVSHEKLKQEYRKLYINNKTFLDGLYYAATVQQGLLPHDRHFQRCFSNYFVLYKPLHIIGGDLYWVANKNNTVYFAAADCTGHGVSGAMLSVLAVSFLNYSVFTKDFKDLGQVLCEIDKKWVETFNLSLDYVFDNDWLELSLASFNFDTRELKFAGANNNLLIAKDHIREIKGDPYPIGGWQIERNRQFTEKSCFLENDTMVYLGSDGFKDQIGGEKGKRFKKRQLYNLLQSISTASMEVQKQTLEETFRHWKGEFQQTDDICILGIKL